jgi:GR25 family glycosyltransferase involved in LPS biosynthesis
MSLLPVFVVSLARAAERRARMVEHLQSIGVVYRVIDAVDGGAIPESERNALTGPGVRLHPGAIGCYLSHLEIYRQMVDEGISAALVLEDDARLHPAFAAVLRDGLTSTDFDYCFLDSDDHNDRVNIYYDRDDAVPVAGNLLAHKLSGGPQTTHAYIITLDAAGRRLDAAFPIMRSIDLYDHLPYAICFRAIVSPKMAWVSADSMVSFTSSKSGSADGLSFTRLRSSPHFYRIRDALKLKGLRRRREAARMVRAGLLLRGRRWAPLPSGREVVL